MMITFNTLVSSKKACDYTFLVCFKKSLRIFTFAFLSCRPHYPANQLSIPPNCLVFRGFPGLKICVHLRAQKIFPLSTLTSSPSACSTARLFVGSIFTLFPPRALPYPPIANFRKLELLPPFSAFKHFFL